MALMGDSRDYPGVRSTHRGREVVKEGFGVRKEERPCSRQQPEEKCLLHFQDRQDGKDAEEMCSCSQLQEWVETGGFRERSLASL